MSALRSIARSLVSKNHNALVQEESNERCQQQEKSVTGNFLLQRAVSDPKYHGTGPHCLERSILQRGLGGHA
jgi:hypothetical protein